MLCGSPLPGRPLVVFFTKSMNNEKRINVNSKAIVRITSLLAVETAVQPRNSRPAMGLASAFRGSLPGRLQAPMGWEVTGKDQGKGATISPRKGMGGTLSEPGPSSLS